MNDTQRSTLEKIVETLEISCKLQERNENHFDGIQKDFNDIAEVMAKMTQEIEKLKAKVSSLEITQVLHATQKYDREEWR